MHWTMHHSNLGPMCLLVHEYETDVPTLRLGVPNPTLRMWVRRWFSVLLEEIDHAHTAEGDL